MSARDSTDGENPFEDTSSIDEQTMDHMFLSRLPPHVPSNDAMYVHGYIFAVLDDQLTHYAQYRNVEHVGPIVLDQTFHCFQRYVDDFDINGSLI